MSAPGPFVGLDYGRKRIGIAVSTILGTVHPRTRLDRTEEAADLGFLKDVAAEVSAAGFVLGLPHHMDGTESDMEREIRGFAVRLAAATDLPVFGSDERLTTEAAESALRAQDLRGRARKARRDSAAACIVLQDFLDAGTKERIA